MVGPRNFFKDLPFRSYWGKSSKLGGVHLFPFHSLDVCAVVAVWWSHSPVLRHHMRAITGLPRERALSWLLFFVALHDLGKLESRFQCKNERAFLRLNRDAAKPAKDPDYWHGEEGASFFFSDFQPDHESAWEPWIDAVAAHHGHFPRKDINDFGAGHLHLMAAQDERARLAWIRFAWEFFLSDTPFETSVRPPELSERASKFIAGLCSVADWIGSIERWEDFGFAYCEDVEKDLAEYFEASKRQAAQLLHKTGVLTRARGNPSLDRLLAEGWSPRDIQVHIDHLPIEPGLYLIEAATGSGKTQAAFALAWRYLAAELAESIIFALPTQVTANSKFVEVSKMAPLMFEESPVLVLAHGRAKLDARFDRLPRNPVPDTAEAYLSEWIDFSKKRVFLGQIGLCTVDQVLLSALPVRHSFVRGFGIGRGVLIIDEVHAYDSYMYGLLEEVLKRQKAAGGTAILLSATLPPAAKRRLLAAWNCETRQFQQESYPLITFANEGTVNFWTAKKTDAIESKAVTITCLPCGGEADEDVMRPDGALLEKVVAAVNAGARVGVVCNLVDHAQRFYRQLAEKLGERADLFHSRFMFKHRQEREGEVIARYGRVESRDGGRVLVATQVIEQSLNLDFDLLVTQLCPADLLFQRMGRLFRYRDDHRPACFNTPECILLLPQKEAYGRHLYIYPDPLILWRTRMLLTSLHTAKLTFPKAYREWVDRVYREQPDPDEPVEWVERHDHLLREAESLRERAENLAKKSKIDADEDLSGFLTRYGAPPTAVLLIHQGQLPYEPDEPYKNAGEELLDRNSLALTSKALKGQEKWQGYSLVKVVPEGESYTGTIGKAKYRYSIECGWEKCS